MAGIVEESRKKTKGSRTVFFIVFTLFAVVGSCMIYPLMIRPLRKTIDAESWEETPCKIISAEVERHSGSDSTTYSIEVKYEYEFKRRKYTSKRYSFVSGSSSGYKGKARAVQRIKENPEPVCYVNPEKPSEAVLKRGWHLGLLFTLFPIPFLGVGVCGLYWFLFIKKRRVGLKSTKKDWLPEAETICGDARLDVSGLGGPVILKSKQNRWWAFFGILLFASVWNGFVWGAGVSEVIKGFAEGQGNWLTALFFVFVLVGIGVGVLAVYLFLALFNPRVTLRLSSARIELGSAMEAEWSFRGQVNRIRRLKLTLKGTELATYRQGTKTRTDKSVFYEFDMFDSEEGGSISSGQIGAVIPGDTMHSFEAANNKIVWEIYVEGDIKRWPDVSESFGIVVTPN
jgi:hypothetical protein